jgi:hypothetical protein
MKDIDPMQSSPISIKNKELLNNLNAKIRDSSLKNISESKYSARSSNEGKLTPGRITPGGGQKFTIGRNAI